MASFKKVQEMLCLCLIEEIIDEEEFVLLYEAYGPSNLPFPHSPYEKFSLANKDPAECKADFRVEKRDITLLLDALRVEGPCMGWLHGHMSKTLLNKRKVLKHTKFN